MSNTNYNAVYNSLFKEDPPKVVTWETSQADIFSLGRGFMEGFDFTMQLQVGCPGGCLFCYVPPAYNLTPPAVRGKQGRTWGFVVRNKEKVIEKFKSHLDSGELAAKTIYWSGVTDPCATPPQITLALWQTLIEAPEALRPRRIAVQTRFRPDRDADLMKQYSEATRPSDEGPPLLISYSIGTDKNELIRAWEKATPLYEQRLKAIETLRRSGLFVVATLSPLGLWNDLTTTHKQFQAWGVAYLTCLFFKQNMPSATTPRLFLNYLREHHPLVLDADWQADRVEEMRQVYGKELVLTGKAGFTSLATPQEVVRIET